jgi:hypothetical protein
MHSMYCTIVPTSNPTLTTQTIWISKIAAAIRHNIFDKDYEDVLFSEVHVDGENVFGSCLAWLNALAVSSYDVVSKRLLEIDYITANTSDPFLGSKPWIDVDLIETNYERFSCQNITAFKNFLAFRTVGSNATCQVDNADSRVFMIKQCSNNVTSFCLDCMDPCDRTQDYCKSSFLNPCYAPVYCNGALASTKTLVFRYQAYSQNLLPKIDTVSFTNVTANMVIANVTLTNSGFLYCALLLNGIPYAYSI